MIAGVVLEVLDFVSRFGETTPNFVAQAVAIKLVVETALDTARMSDENA